MSKQVVTLNLFYGAPTYDVAGKVTSRNEPVKIIHDSTEWENFLKHLNVTGISKVEVLKVVNLKDDSEVEDFSKITDEVKAYFKTNEVPLTAEQKQIQELQKQIDELKNSNAPKEPETTLVVELEGVENKSNEIIENQTPAAKIAEIIKNNPKNGDSKTPKATDVKDAVVANAPKE